MKCKNNFSIDYQFVPRPIEMLQTPAYKRLSLSARRILECIEIAYSKAPSANGKLRISYRKFLEYGVRWRSIKSALDELVAAGIIEITYKGRSSPFVQFRRVTEYRLTYRPAAGAAPTHDWKRPHYNTARREWPKRYQSDVAETASITPERLAEMPINPVAETASPVDYSPSAAPGRRGEVGSASDAAADHAAAATAYAVVRPFPFAVSRDAMAAYTVGSDVGVCSRPPVDGLCTAGPRRRASWP